MVDLRQTLLSEIECFRVAEFQTGAKCLRCDNLPSENASIEELSDWLSQALRETRRLMISNGKLNQMSFAPKSEKILKEANKVEQKCKKLKNKHPLTEKKRDELVAELREKKEKVEMRIQENLDDELKAQENTRRLADMVQRIQAQIDELMRREVIPDPEEDESDSDPKSDADNQSDSSQQPDASQQPDSSPQSSFQDTDRIRPEERRQIDDCAKKVDEHKRQHKEEESANDTNDKGIDSEKLPRDDKSCKVKPKPQDKERNPASGNLESTHELPSMEKQITLLDESYNQMKQSVAIVVELQNKDGERFILHPATCKEVEGLDQNGNVTANVDSALILNPDTPEREKLKERLNSCGYSARLLNIMTVLGGMLVFSPTEFLGIPSQLYGMRPCFVRSPISEQMAIKILIDFILLHLPKSRIADCMGLRWGEVALTKQQIITLINGMCRAFSPLAQLLRRILLESSTTMHNDDCVVQCLEGQKDDEGNKVRSKSYLWGLTTGAHEEKQGVIYLAAISRNADEFLRQFGYSTNDDGSEVILPCALQHLVTDCCSVYIPGIGRLEGLTGHEIVRGGCYAHLRRYFRDALLAMKLLGVFEAASQGPLVGFEQRVEAELAARQMTSGSYGRKVMFACFMIELIFRLEEDFTFTSKSELEERRQTVTVICVNALYETIEELKAATKSIEQNGERNGVPQYKGGKDVPWGTAIVYALNNKTELYAFLYCGDMECSNNRIERLLRAGKAHSRVMEFLATKSGFMAFADLMTLYRTCRINDINPYEYLHWAFVNAKMRVEDYRIATSQKKETTAQICWMPTPYTKDGKTINLYDEEYKCCFDEISWEGLDIWSYMKLLKEESPRVKLEYRRDRK